LKFGPGVVVPCLLLGACAGLGPLENRNGALPTSRVIEDPSESAQPVALQVLRHLAAGEIAEAAQLSNAPQRRHQVLLDYLASVGEEEFKRVYGEYLLPENRVMVEIAIGPRRLIVWRLASAGDRLAAQYYVETVGRFLMDDVPSAERRQLARILEAYRSKR